MPVSSAGFRTGQTGHVPRGLHKKGPPQKQTSFLNIEDVCHTCHSLQVVGLYYNSASLHCDLSLNYFAFK